MLHKGAGLFYVHREPRWIVGQLILLENLNPQAERDSNREPSVVTDLSSEQGLEVT